MSIMKAFSSGSSIAILKQFGEKLVGSSSPVLLSTLKELDAVEDKHFTVLAMKASKIGMVVVKFKNHDNDEVKTLARKLVLKWKDILNLNVPKAGSSTVLGQKRKFGNLEALDAKLFAATPRSIYMGGPCTFASEDWADPVMKTSGKQGGNPTRVLWWCRSDVRTQDNTALDRAANDAAKGVNGGVVALFVVSPAEWKTYDWGLCRVNFLMRSVRELYLRLKELGIPLMVVRAASEEDVKERVVQSALDAGCDAVYVNRQYEVFETRRDKQIQARLKEKQIGFSAFHDECIVPPVEGLVVSKTGNPYKVYTPFKKNWWRLVQNKNSKYLSLADEVAKQDPPPEVKGAVIDAEAIPLEFSKDFSGQSHQALYPAGETAGHKVLQEWVKTKVAKYDKTRDVPSMLGTSSLSHFLACGVLSARQCARAAVQQNHGKVDHGKEGIVIWIQEIIWRDFYRHVVVNWPYVVRNQSFKASFEGIPWRNDKAEFQKWCEGRTGYPIVDAGMRQLRETGFMHNRARMIVANFLVKDLLIDWKWGERYFMRNLIDCDVASNSGGWQWSAGCGTDAQPYFRILNPDTQSERFDPDCAYIKKYIPELRSLSPSQIKKLKDNASLARKCKYPVRMCDHKKRRLETLATFKEKLNEGKNQSPVK